jgi:hypothetical protein
MAAIPPSRADTGVNVEPTTKVVTSVGVPPWLGPLLQGITLVTLLGCVFTAGIWKGQIDTKLEVLQRASDDQKEQLKVMREDLKDLEKSVSRLQGQLEASSVHKKNQ